eukprot:6207623-Pleurochrysis_carterae.AAC.2
MRTLTITSANLQCPVSVVRGFVFCPRAFYSALKSAHPLDCRRATQSSRPRAGVHAAYTLKELSPTKRVWIFSVARYGKCLFLGLASAIRLTQILPPLHLSPFRFLLFLADTFPAQAHDARS